MGEKITIDTDALRALIREEMKSAPADTKDAAEEVEEEIEEVVDEAADDVDEAAEDSEKKLNDMSPKEVEAFFAKVVKNAMSELDTKKSTPTKKPAVKPKPPRRNEDADETPDPVRERHNERESAPIPPPKRRRSFWGDDE